MIGSIFRMKDVILLRSVSAYLIVGLFVAVQFILQGIVSLMVPELKADLGLTEVGVGVLASLFFYPYVLLQVPAGWLLPRMGIRNLMAMAALLMASGCFVESVADTALLAMLGRCLMGVGAAPGIVCFLSTVERVIPASYFGLFAASTELFGMLGAGVGDFLIPQGIRVYGWHGVLEWFGYGVIGLFFCCLVLPGRQAGNCKGEENSSCWRDGLNNRNVWFVAFYSGLMFAVLNAFAALWAIPFLETHAACHQSASDMAGMIFLGATVGALLLGWVSDRRSDVRGLMLVCTALTILLFLLMLYDRFPTVVYYPLMFGIGLCSSSYILPFMMEKRWLKGAALSTAMALTNAVSVLVGALIYQPLIGWLISLYPQICLESFRQVLMLIPIGMILAIFLLVSLRPESDSAKPLSPGQGSGNLVP